MDRKTHWQRNKHLDSHIDIETKRHTKKETKGQTDKQRHRDLENRWRTGGSKTPLSQEDDNIHKNVEQKNTQKCKTDSFCILRVSIRVHNFAVEA